MADASLTEIEVAWSDPLGHAQGKRLPAAQFLDRAQGSGFAFREAALAWNSEGSVVDGFRLANWDRGHPDVFAVPDFTTSRPVPWQPGIAKVGVELEFYLLNPDGLRPRRLRAATASWGASGRKLVRRGPPVAGVADFAAMAHSKWLECAGQVTDWERRRYLARS